MKITSIFYRTYIYLFLFSSIIWFHKTAGAVNSKNQNNYDDNTRTGSGNDRNTRNGDGSNLCSTTQLSVKKEKFTFTWKIENLGPVLSDYDGTLRLFKVDSNEVRVNGDQFGGKWNFSLTNTKKHGVMAVYANYTYGRTNKTNRSKNKNFFKISMNCSVRKYNDAPVHSDHTFIGIEKINTPKNYISSCAAPTSASASSSVRSRSSLISSSANSCCCNGLRNRDNEDPDLYHVDYDTIPLGQASFSLFEFPRVQIFASENSEGKTEIRDSLSVTLRFEINTVNTQEKQSNHFCDAGSHNDRTE